MLSRFLHVYAHSTWTTLTSQEQNLGTAAVRTMELVSVVTVPSVGRPQTYRLLPTTWAHLAGPRWLTPFRFSVARAPLINTESDALRKWKLPHLVTGRLMKGFPMWLTPLVFTTNRNTHLNEEFWELVLFIYNFYQGSTWEHNKNQTKHDQAHPTSTGYYHSLEFFCQHNGQKNWI